MLNFENPYRWCDELGGGLVIASSVDDAKEKLVKKFGADRKDFIVWLWTDDDYFDKENEDVFDIYGL